ncbi:MAG: hypothetical protein R2940_17800 [Syntrophotaleaceae bacterium]
MLKMVFAVGICLVMSMTALAHGMDDGPDGQDLVEKLNSGSSAQRIQIAKVITQSGIENQALYAKIASLLREGYPLATDSDKVDEMSWLCKALAASGNQEYRPLLQEIADLAPSAKLQRYAAQSSDLIGEYAERMRILNETKNWSGDLTEEENRLVAMLNSDKIQLKKDAAKTVARKMSAHEKVYEVVAAELQKMVAEGRSSSDDIDTMAWMCKALAASGNRKHAATLTQVHDKTANMKLKTHASKALKQID